MLKTSENLSPEEIADLPDPSRPCIAAASLEGLLVNQHLGEARRLYIYKWNNGGMEPVETRAAPGPGGGDARWNELAGRLEDCRALLVSGAGKKPKNILTQSGIQVYEVEGMIEDAVSRIFSGQSVKHLVKRAVTLCGAECSGGGMGCG